MESNPRLDPATIADLPTKVRRTLAKIIACHRDEYTGPLTIHFKDGYPQRYIREEREDF